MKKLIQITLAVIAITFSNLAWSAEIETWKTNYTSGSDIWIELIDRPGNYGDWIGIYPVGSTNDWGNVVKWVWARNPTPSQDAGDWYKFKLPDEQYEARFFLNNSFDVDQNIGFTVGSNNTSIKTWKTTYTSGSDVWIELINKPDNNKDWIGIYPAGSTNDWGNVVDWVWARDISPSQDAGDWYKFKLADGQYEARFFLNNTFNTRSQAQFSIKSDNDDAKYFYQNLDISQSANRITVKNNGQVLMDSKISDFNRSIDGLNISPKIEAKLGGFDITYTIKTSNEAKNLDFGLIIPGIKFATEKNLHVLNTRTYFYPIEREVTLGNEINIDDTESGRYNINYPRSYSPVIVAHNDNFAVGASVKTNFTKDKIAFSQRILHQRDGKWSYIFQTWGSGADEAGNNEISIRKIGPNDKLNITLSIRFAPKRYWLMTLAPYKNYFNGQFPNKNINISDTKPIIGLDLSYPSNKEGDYPDDSSRVYNAHIKLHNTGFNARFNDTLKNLMEENDYHRFMLWGIGGQFDGRQEHLYNMIPPQFMSNLPDGDQGAIGRSFGNLKNTFANNEYSYGFWWGLSGQIPIKNGVISTEWNPDSFTPHALDNDYHNTFAMNELDLAVSRGAKEIGLDAFTNMRVEDQLPWIKRMKDKYPTVKFWEESVQSDYLHTQTSLFLQPNIEWYNRNMIGSNYRLPPLLTKYLNPNAEVLIYLTGTWGDGRKGVNRDYIKKLTKMGYTPLLIPSESNIFGANPLVNIKNIDTTLYECSDGKDNDGDGKIDWPYDDGCSSAIDNE